MIIEGLRLYKQVCLENEMDGQKKIINARKRKNKNEDREIKFQYSWLSIILLTK